MKQFEWFRLDARNECLWCKDEQIALAPKPFAVLRYLVENPGRLITHDELLDALWPEIYVQPQILRTYMLELRKALGDDAVKPRFIQTLPKRGYCFVAAVKEVAAAAGGAWSAEGEPAAAHIVDRLDEMALLKAQAVLAMRGQRRVVFVTGEPGIGKTTLVDAFCAQAALLPATVVRGQCVQGVGRAEEYYPVKEALAELCASAEGEAARRALATMAPGWLPEQGRGQSREQSRIQGREQNREQGRAQGREPTAPANSVAGERMPGDLCGVLEQLAAAKLLIFVFDDLHWADESTLNLISALARRRAPAKLMVLAAYRPRDQETGHPLKELKQDLLTHRLCAELALAPLERRAMSQLLSRELGQETLPEGLVEFVHARSEGNPLFAIAILEHLIAERTLARGDGDAAAAWEQAGPFPDPETGVPGELAQLIELEIERLAAADQRMLEAASLIEVAFPAWAVAAALQKDATEVEEGCDALARRVYFLHRCGREELPDGSSSAFYAFAHSLYREVLYRRQATARRAERHIRVAERLAGLFKGREGTIAREMAMHFKAAGAWQAASDALRAAAHHALERHAGGEAEELLERALGVAANLHGAGGRATEEEIRSELTAARAGA
ncbi:MAG: AAA family ATPase [Terracidiphilus sp.]